MEFNFFQVKCLIENSYVILSPERKKKNKYKYKRIYDIIRKKKKKIRSVNQGFIRTSCLWIIIFLFNYN